jgi:ribosome-associated protein
MKNTEINGEYIKLEQLLKFCGSCPTGGSAKIAIKSGNVKVNGDICLQRGKKLFDGDIVSFENKDYKVVKK